MDNDIGQSGEIRVSMFNNINDSNNEFLYNRQLDNNNVLNLAALRAAANRNRIGGNNNPYVDKTEISANALELFNRDCDINKFNKIAMSNPNDLSHLDRMNELFASGVVDVFEDDVLESLVTNSKLLDDLNL